MGGCGIAVFGVAASNLRHGVVPEQTTMGLVGTIALLANLLVAVMLVACRNGGANRRSVWLCTRNDVIGNARSGLKAPAAVLSQSAVVDLKRGLIDESDIEASI